MEARQRLVSAMQEVLPADRDERWQTRFDDIDHCLEDIYGKGAADVARVADDGRTRQSQGLPPGR
jgi:GrpB-like predicted nucleotidyltransferase (UPF0157 family)